MSSELRENERGADVETYLFVLLGSNYVLGLKLKWCDVSVTFFLSSYEQSPCYMASNRNMHTTPKEFTNPVLQRETRVGSLAKARKIESFLLQ